MSDNSGLIVAALLKTNPTLAAEIDAENSWKESVKIRGARVNLYRRYERGDHRQNMTTQMRRMLRLPNDDTKFSEYNINYCKVIIDKMTSRISVSNISVDNETSEKWLKDLLIKNDFESQQIEWFRGGARDGDSYVFVEPGTLNWISEPAYDGFSGVEVIYDKTGKKPIWACKLWSEADVQDIKETDDSNTSAKMYVVVYQPDRISSYSGTEGGADIIEEPALSVNNWNGKEFSEQIVQEIPWSIEGRSLPFVVISNQKDNYTSHGESELRPAIPPQDSLNSIQHDKTMASKLSAFPQYWSIGFKIDMDGVLPGAVHNMVLEKDGQLIIEPSPEQVEFLKSARVGQFAGADITQYTDQIEKEVMQICQVTQTPVYGVTTQGNLSGEALKQLEIGLIGKVERFQRQNTDALKELIFLTAKIQNAFAGENAPSFKTVNIVWKSPEILDVNSRIAALAQTRAQFPGLWSDEFYMERIGSLLGMSKDDIAKEVEKAAKRKLEAKDNIDMFGDEE